MRKTETLAANILKFKPEKEENPSNEINVDYIAEISNELSAAVGRKVRLVEGRKNGRIEIEFYGADDREALIDAIRKLKI